MPARKVPASASGPGLTIPMGCDRTARWKRALPDRKPMTSGAPSQGTCQRCLRTMVRLIREARRREDASQAPTPHGNPEPPTASHPW